MNQKVTRMVWLFDENWMHCNNCRVFLKWQESIEVNFCKYLRHTKEGDEQVITLDEQKKHDRPMKAGKQSSLVSKAPRNILKGNWISYYKMETHELKTNKKPISSWNAKGNSKTPQAEKFIIYMTECSNTLFVQIFYSLIKISTKT